MSDHQPLSLSIMIRGPFLGCADSSGHRDNLILVAFLVHQHKQNLGKRVQNLEKRVQAQSGLLHFTIWKLFLSTIGKEVVIYSEALSPSTYFILFQSPFSFALNFFSRALCSRLGCHLNFAQNHLWSLIKNKKKNLDFFPSCGFHSRVGEWLGNLYFEKAP